jgi:hypothetical protein
MGRMLAMTGTLRLDDRGADEVTRWLHHYQTIRITDDQRVVLIPPIGSFLIDWDPTAVRIHVAARTRGEIDELIAQLEDELHRCPGMPRPVEWETSSVVPVPFR